MTTIHSTRALGEVVRGRRLDRGLSQSDLADRVGVSRKWIIDVEHGKPTAEVGLILRLLDALGLDLHATARGAPAEGDDRPATATVDLDELLRAYGR